MEIAQLRVSASILDTHILCFFVLWPISAIHCFHYVTCSVYWETGNYDLYPTIRIDTIIYWKSILWIVPALVNTSDNVGTISHYLSSVVSINRSYWWLYILTKVQCINFFFRMKSTSPVSAWSTYLMQSQPFIKGIWNDLCTLFSDTLQVLFFSFQYLDISGSWQTLWAATSRLHGSFECPREQLFRMLLNSFLVTGVKNRLIQF